MDGKPKSRGEYHNFFEGLQPRELECVVKDLLRFTILNMKDDFAYALSKDMTKPDSDVKAGFRRLQTYWLLVSENSRKKNLKIDALTAEVERLRAALHFAVKGAKDFNDTGEPNDLMSIVSECSSVSEAIAEVLRAAKPPEVE